MVPMATKAYGKGKKGLNSGSASSSSSAIFLCKIVRTPASSHPGHSTLFTNSEREEVREKPEKISAQGKPMAGADAVLASPATRRTASCRALGRLPSSARGDVTFSLGVPCGEEEEHRHSLDACSLCRRPLGASSDVFMYRGDTPFCSEECRQEQIELDEARKEEKAGYWRGRRRRQHRSSHRVKDPAAEAAEVQSIHTTAAETAVAG